VPDKGSFCPGCGATVATAATPAARVTAIVVFGAFAVLSAAGFYFFVQPSSDPPERAVPGSATASTAATPSSVAGGQGSGLPGGHPNIELPPEIMKFMDQLTATAEADPENLEAWQNLARARYRAALLNASFYKSAVAALDRVEELDPDNLEAIRTRGNIAYDMRRFDEAEKHFRHYLELNPEDLGVRTDLGTALLFNSDIEGAKQLYRAVIEADPNFAQAHVNLGIALNREGKVEEATKLFSRAKELAETDEQRQRLDDLIAVTNGKTAPVRPATQPTTRTMTSNAADSFQKEVDKLFTAHHIVGPRVGSIEWSGAGKARVRLRDFPMDQMPPVMRNKFKSKINESMAKLATEHSVEGPLLVELVDSASGNVMDSLDGKQWVGAFDEAQYE
jgi:Flp pilus assembly protein TadD